MKNKKVIIGLFALGLALLLGGMMTQATFAQGGSQCDQDPNCELYNNVGDTGAVGWTWSTTVPGDITKVEIVGGNANLPGACFDVSKNGNQVTITRLIAEAGAGGPDGHGCRFISHINVWWKTPEVTNTWQWSADGYCDRWVVTVSAPGANVTISPGYSGGWGSGNSVDVSFTATWTSGNPLTRSKSVTITRPDDCNEDRNQLNVSTFPGCTGWSIDVTLVGQGTFSCTPGTSGNWGGGNSVDVACSASFGSGNPSEANWSGTLTKPTEGCEENKAFASFRPKGCKGSGNQAALVSLDHAVAVITGPKNFYKEVSQSTTLTGLRTGTYSYSWHGVDGYKGSDEGTFDIGKCGEIVQRQTGSEGPQEVSWQFAVVGLVLLSVGVGSALKNRRSQTSL